MSQEVFVRRHEQRWQELDQLLLRMESTQSISAPLDTFAPDYRRLCQQLAIARHRHYSADVVERLNGLVLRAHSQMYGTRVDGLGSQARRLLAAFPAAVRREWRLVLIAHLLFYLPYLGMMVAVIGWPELVQTIMSPEDLAQMEWMYDPSSEHFLKERSLNGDMLMFGCAGRVAVEPQGMVPAGTLRTPKDLMEIVMLHKRKVIRSNENNKIPRLASGSAGIFPITQQGVAHFSHEP